MLNLSGQKNLNFILVLLAIYHLGCTPENSEKQKDTKPEIFTSEIKVDTVPILSARKIELTKAYCNKYYGFNDYKLDSIKMVVIHHTVIPTLEQTLALFRKDELNPNRKFINRFSSLNVGIHYVIDRDGHIYNLLPDTVIARHIIGFNHVSIGIENVAKSKEDLTEAQLQSNIELVRVLKMKHPTIKYLIGHDEYNNPELPHYALFKSLDKAYKPYDKPDPGVKFMFDLRSQLMKKYSFEFLD